ncbi:MAG: hypothetical protein R6V10_08955, partial [bacterium]
MVKYMKKAGLFDAGGVRQTSFTMYLQTHFVSLPTQRVVWAIRMAEWCSPFDKEELYVADWKLKRNVLIAVDAGGG